ncbi:type II-B CRISPR-associated RNA-guided endonuclease Cas9/Csx12 [Francisella tularensis subsp. novicida]|uniref:type II-B CRISPR-associated RNA-guided endonuclease Cas9/Csx12 n=1 Tax=Francisella tularensis TaxID=263 RepID=UPI000500228D|nr:type II-B CRISPR-associated RNA-guided endonuclease Cas9/Csx12 [Francisella tularensis]AJJ46981.1 HNH endonuclease family protein [Francisella tularensis subsp. novicida]KFJ68925.1 HNH endonuclease family protein [Francisella tularensis subsp. novicida]MBK2345177.1 type II-B CRISPR-associated RNA-guided endonuclease Cas9/Csx12 [Francisella tularensis subsp. novicida]MBK2350529.1 type II-B CRISPR-associated RNA-guided endonuclease Cas9/Csx12 [Francisella tularensis subsp. novicida]MBK2354088
MNVKILPIAIDLGVKNTGVFSAFYQKGTSLERLDNKNGKVYELSKDSYTLLMNNRTARRHQRRGIDRKQLVKRLFKLIWTEQLNLEWDKDTQQAISFLFNRRGFSFITDGYSPEYLNIVPEQVKAILMDIFDDYNGEDDLDSYLKLATEQESKISEIYNKLMQKILEFKLRKLCTDIKDDKVSTKTLKEITSYEFELLADYLANYSEILKTQKFSYTDKQGNLKELSYYHHDKYNIQEFLKRHATINDEILDTLLTDDLDIWNFNFEKFDFDKNEEKLQNQEDKDHTQAHLHHFVFAVNKIKSEMASGGRHRGQYFQEITNVLDENNHQEGYLKNFCENLHNKKYSNLSVKNLVNLIGNLSNLELKPLRKYFNDKIHAKADHWDEQKFTETYCHWILGEWRVGVKDQDKKDGAKYSYKDLCNELKQKVTKAGLVDFLLELDPCRTIPPYLDNNNRKPPKCQSLILNPKFLDNQYPNWQQYLQELKKLQSIQNYLESFETDLKVLKSSKDQPYFVEYKSSNQQIASGQRDYKDLDARILQFIFDRVKASDELLLNEIYFQAKKLKQKASSELEKLESSKKLDEVIANSQLSQILKSQHTNGIFEQGTFLHLVCKYYKQRQRARDSRLYIMPEYRYDKKLDKYNNTGRFDDDNQLLTYCNHKPRQKRYQLLNDLAGVLQVSPNFLKDKIGSDDDLFISKWLVEHIRGFKKACEDSLKIQKDNRGLLNHKINIARNTKGKCEKEIFNLICKIEGSEDKKGNYKHGLAYELGVLLFGEPNEASKPEFDRKIKKFNSIYSFAQIQQIAFAERKGNANSCAVCSADNAHRMQQIKITEPVEDNKDKIILSAKAQRLPAIPTRIVDGAVKKMATILAKNIVDDNWQNIKQVLSAKHQLHIPIITESNAFEFEPALADVKGKSIKDRRKKALERISPENIFKDKNNRIKEFAKGISAYSGDNLASGDFDGAKEELDHIIPRSHKKYGTLNDEANLICVTRDDNKNKGNRIFCLHDLANNYKLKQFETTDDLEIEKKIADTIWDASKKDFKFGNYRSFINLTPQEQKAFRHALFLADENPIKQAVIRAINNRNRTFVNGTQRYFAEVLANNIYLRAKKENLNTDKISFDYFGIPTIGNGRGIAEIRQLYEKVDSDIQAYAKGDKPQASYSHLIDAMLAFCIAADEHRNDGSIGLEIDKNYSLYPLDKNTGEVFTKDIFSQIKITNNEFSDKKLVRKKATEGFNTHRQMTRDGIYAENYLPILIHKELDEVRKGYTWGNSEELKIHKGKKYDIQQLNNLVYCLKFIDKSISIDIQISTLEELRNILTTNNIATTAEYYYINLKTQKLHEYYIENYNTALGYKKYTKEMEFLRSLAYRSERVKIKSIDDVKQVLDKDSNFIIGKITLPFKKEWQRLYREWQNTTIKDDYEFLKSFFNVKSITKLHKKVRKDFSLPISTNEGKFLVKRKTWDNNFIYQILNDSDSRVDGTKPFIPAFDISKNEIVEAIIDSFTSKNIFWLPKNIELQKVDNKNIFAIDTSKWFEVETPSDLRDIGVATIQYKIDNNSRPKVRVKLDYVIDDDSKINYFTNHSLLKSRYPDKVLEILKQSTIIEFESSGFNKTIKEMLGMTLAGIYNETSNN